MEPAVRTSTDADNVLTILLDVPGKPVNVCTPQLLAELSAVVDSLAASKSKAVIIASAKARSFNAGADLFTIRDMDPQQSGAYLATGQALFERIRSLPMPTVAAINGDCLGGGMELALACTYRVAADDGSITLGLPEVKLGLIPAWGGATHLPRMIGLAGALRIMLAGRTMPPRDARKRGLVDEVVRPEALLAAARRLVLSRRASVRPRWWQRLGGALAPVRNRILAAARRQTLERTYENYPAPLRLLEVVKTGRDQGVAAGLTAEREAILQLMRTEATRNLLRVFFLRQGAKRRAAARLRSKPSEVKNAAVVGGGTMGAGIVHALVRAGVHVRLVEVNTATAAAALGRIRGLLDEDVSAGRLDALGARHAFNRVAPTTEWTGLELPDLVVEAVVETVDAKRDVFARLEALTRPDAVLATNTSSLRVAEIAGSVNRRGRVIGMHFFNPVNRMPLVEVVRGPESDDPALATAVALATAIGKTPVLVSDAPGFLVNRLLIPHLVEALAMAAEGTPVVVLDEAMKRWGMPMGPFELLDEIGLDVAVHVLKALSAVRPDGLSLPGALDRAVAQAWLGRKSGIGFYVYGTGSKKKKERKPALNHEMAALLAGGHGVPAAADADVQWRLVLPMVNEAARALSEGVTDSADDIDLATVLGLGFAPFRGGLARFVEDAGAEPLVRRLEEHAARLGPRFTPAELLCGMARDHRPFPR